MTALRNLRLIEGGATAATAPQDIVIAEGRIAAVGPGAAEGQGRDMGGRWATPGLIDAHVHVTAFSERLRENAAARDSYVALRAAGILRGMLARGFTTVRDMGGADAGLRAALAEGLIPGPRLLICGQALSQTGGHMDFRRPLEALPAPDPFPKLGALGTCVDGREAVRARARALISGGADFLKVMASGGDSSEEDHGDRLGFADDEITAAVEVAGAARTYVAAHAYSDAAVARAVRLGARTVEHAMFAGAETARAMAEAGAVAVPTLLVFEDLVTHAEAYGLTAAQSARMRDLAAGGRAALQVFREAGTVVAFGSDCLGGMHPRQGEEFLLRAEVLPVHEVLAQATMGAARALGRDDIGTLRPGAWGDVAVWQADPLADPEVLARGPALILKGGRAMKDETA